MRMEATESCVAAMSQSTELMVVDKAGIRKRNVVKVKLASAADKDVREALGRLATACDSRRVTEVDIRRVTDSEIIWLRKITEVALRDRDVVNMILIAASKSEMKEKKRPRCREQSAEDPARRPRERGESRTQSQWSSARGANPTQTFFALWRRRSKGQSEVVVDVVKKAGDGLVVL